MTERIRLQTQASEMIYLFRVVQLSLRDRVRGNYAEAVWSRAADPSHQKEPIEMVWASD